MPGQDFSYSPASLLARFFSEGTNLPQLVLVTGPSGSGKTTWCLELVELARASGITAAGLLSPPVFDSGSKTGIDLLDLSSGQRCRLARHRSVAEQDAPQPDSERTPAEQESELFTGDWQFDRRALAWGNQILKLLSHANLLILDEPGPLEFQLGAGLQAGLGLIDSRCYRLALVTIRPGLLDAARQRWPWGEVLDVTAWRQRGSGS